MKTFKQGQKVRIINTAITAIVLRETSDMIEVLLLSSEETAIYHPEQLVKPFDEILTDAIMWLMGDGFKKIIYNTTFFFGMFTALVWLAKELINLLK